MAVTAKLCFQIPVLSVQFLVECCHLPTFVRLVLIRVESNLRCTVSSIHSVLL